MAQQTWHGMKLADKVEELIDYSCVGHSLRPFASATAMLHWMVLPKVRPTKLSHHARRTDVPKIPDLITTVEESIAPLITMTK